MPKKPSTMGDRGVKSTMETLLEEKVLYRTLKGSISAIYVFGTPKRFYTLLKKGSYGFYIEPQGSVLGQ